MNRIRSGACTCAVMLAFASGAGSAQQETSTVLTIEEGSYFTMGGDTELLAPGFEGQWLVGWEHLQLDVVQPASGSHEGAPDGTESPGIDAPWLFFFGTGMHLTQSPVRVLSGVGNQFELDFSGWGFTLFGVDFTPLGSGAWVGNQEGVALLECAIDCGLGDSYTLTYSATVPDGDPTNFGGVAYYLKLIGHISDGPFEGAKGILVDIPAGGTQECADFGGHEVDFIATVGEPEGITAETVTWLLDDVSIGTGQTLTSFVGVGTHQVVAEVLYSDGDLIRSLPFGLLVEDTQAPAFTVELVRAQGGVETRFEAVDVCDPAPVTTGVLGAPKQLGDIIDVRPQAGEIRFETTELELTASTSDAAGNTASGSARLELAP